MKLSEALKILKPAMDYALVHHSQHVFVDPRAGDGVYPGYFYLNKSDSKFIWYLVKGTSWGSRYTDAPEKYPAVFSPEIVAAARLYEAWIQGPEFFK